MSAYYNNLYQHIHVFVTQNKALFTVTNSNSNLSTTTSVWNYGGTPLHDGGKFETSIQLETKEYTESRELRHQ